MSVIISFHLSFISIDCPSRYSFDRFGLVDNGEVKFLFFKRMLDTSASLINFIRIDLGRFSFSENFPSQSKSLIELDWIELSTSDKTEMILSMSSNKGLN